MKNATFYFSHDYNTRSNDKIRLLLRKHGPLGYGIFWMITEDLYNNSNSLKMDYEDIAYDYRVDIDIVKSIIVDFGLFKINNGTISSDGVEERLKIRKDKSEKTSKAAQAKWDKAKTKDADALEKDADAMHTECKCNAIKERREKEKKVKKEKLFNDVPSYESSLEEENEILGPLNSKNSNQ